MVGSSWPGWWRAYSNEAHCARCLLPGGCGAAELVNDGALFQSPAAMNPGLAAGADSEPPWCRGP